MAIGRLGFSFSFVQGSLSDPMPSYWVVDNESEAQEVASGTVVNQNGPLPTIQSFIGDFVFVKDLKILYVLQAFGVLRPI